MDIVKELYGSSAAVVGLGIYGKKAKILLSYLQMCIAASRLISFDDNGGGVNYFYIPLGGKNYGFSDYTETRRAEVVRPDGKPVSFGHNAIFDSSLVEQYFCGIVQREDGEVCAVVCDDLQDVRLKNEMLQCICSAASTTLKKMFEKKLFKLGSFTIRLKKTTEIDLDVDCGAMLASDGDEKNHLSSDTEVECFYGSKLKARMMKSVKEEKEDFTVNEAKAIIDDACAVAYGKPVDKSREWLKPEPDVIKIEAAKVKKIAYEKTIEELMTHFMEEAEAGIAEAVRNSISEKQKEMAKKLAASGFSKLI